MTLLFYYLESWRPELAHMMEELVQSRSELKHSGSPSQISYFDSSMTSAIWIPHQYLCITWSQELGRLNSEMEALGNIVQKHPSLHRFSFLIPAQLGQPKSICVATCQYSPQSQRHCTSCQSISCASCPKTHKIISVAFEFRLTLSTHCN